MKLDIDEMVATVLKMVDIGKDIPTGVRLHPDDYKMLWNECTVPGTPGAFDLPVYPDPTIPRGTHKLMFREEPRLLFREEPRLPLIFPPIFPSRSES